MPIDQTLSDIFLSIRGGLARAVSGIVPPKEIEDVVQETYVRVCQSANLEDIRSPRSFLYRTARNIAINQVTRAESRWSESLSDGETAARFESQEAAPDTFDQVCSDEEFAMFCDAVRGLPVQCRRAFVMKKVYGHSYREIAASMQISEKTVEKHIARGIIQCREFMQQQGGSPRAADAASLPGDSA